jgi:hypothetical protein
LACFWWREWDSEYVVEMKAETVSPPEDVVSKITLMNGVAVLEVARGTAVR